MQKQSRSGSRMSARVAASARACGQCLLCRVSPAGACVRALRCQRQGGCCSQWFQQIDRDHNGSLDVFELQRALALGNLNFSLKTVAHMIRWVACGTAGGRGTFDKSLDRTPVLHRTAAVLCYSHTTRCIPVPVGLAAAASASLRVMETPCGCVEGSQAPQPHHAPVCLHLCGLYPARVGELAGTQNPRWSVCGFCPGETMTAEPSPLARINACSSMLTR